MATFYGIEENTDMKCPQTKVVRLRSLAAALAFISKPSEYAFPGAADGSLPGSQQNWHHRLRTAYEMPAGWRISKREVDAMHAHEVRGGSVYRKSRTGCEAHFIVRDGTRVKRALSATEGGAP